jgi:phosphoenolpyruvate synthase/pyruvate phosphate dikinase
MRSDEKSPNEISQRKTDDSFCRTRRRKVLAEMAANKLVQGENGLEVYVMIEIPSNVILADEFASF